ncbi:ead/Ea22-like family protein [Salmonella enterica]|nr:ead/Ea22-like family protein [Salmonella enterica]EGL7479754.1 ead/Ea22-like family protein [Salmonella enterica]EIZ2335927.1 ead/Ea22-like family protein [Salmonella enterica]
MPSIQAAMDADILETLLDELEATQSYAKDRDEENQDLMLTVGRLRAEMSARIEELESQRKLAFTASNRWADKFREAARRIAELEARTVNLPKRSVGEVMQMSGFSRDYAEGWCAGNDNAIHEIRTAGIKVKGE